MKLAPARRTLALALALAAAVGTSTTEAAAIDARDLVLKERAPSDHHQAWIRRQPIPDAEPATFTLALKRRNMANVERQLQERSDPDHPH